MLMFETHRQDKKCLPGVHLDTVVMSYSEVKRVLSSVLVMVKDDPKPKLQKM